jgi:aminoglycoside phosphotransferase (APT) family kinase protein
MLRTTPPDRDLADVGASLGSNLVAAEPVRWGDARATFRVVLADGRVFAARRMARADAAQARQVAATMGVFANAGLPTVPPVLTTTPGATWLSVPWVEGATGAAWLDEPRRARRMAESMGRIARRIERIPGTDLVAVAPPGHDADHRARIDAWLATAALEPTVRRVVESVVAQRAHDRHPSTAMHGDFAPINVIVDDAGEVKALLDFEHARLGPAHADVAWWGWVVRHHHPAAWAAAWPTFCQAAGVDSGVAARDLHALALVGLLERAATALEGAARQRWVERLSEAAQWPVSGGDQAT